MTQYIDMTPTWAEILPTWQTIVADATKTKKPEQMQRFWQEMESMARAADNWNRFGSKLLERCIEAGFDWDILGEAQAHFNLGASKE